MKTYLILLFFSLLTISSMEKMSLRHSFPSEAILGTWLTQDQEGHVQIYKKDDKYFGKITWLKEPNDEKGQPFTDTENPNPALKSRPLIDLDVALNFEYQNEEWINGQLYDPETGKSYKGKMWLTNDGQSLKVRGYWSVFYLTETWKKM